MKPYVIICKLLHSKMDLETNKACFIKMRKCTFFPPNEMYTITSSVVRVNIVIL